MAAGDIVLRDPGAALGDISLASGATTPNIFVNVGGVSKRAVAIYMNVGGVAKLMTNVSVNVGGVQKDVVFS